MSEMYYKQKNIENIKKTNKVLIDLPLFVYDYFVSIESSSTPLTRLNYALDLKNFFNYLSSILFSKSTKTITISDIDSLKAVDIERYLSFLSNYETKDNDNLSNSDSTKARKLSSVRSLLRYLFSRDLITSNVASKVRSPKIRQKEIVRLEIDEVSKLLNFVESPLSLSERQRSYNYLTRKRDVALLSLLLGTGIRVSECVGINVEDIDFDQNAFKITRKGGSVVVLYFSDEVASALIDWLEQREEKNLPPTEKALFVSLQNKRLTVRAIENIVKKYAHEVSPLKKISPHKLRSTYGTNLYRETKDIYIVADVLGHKDVNTTKRHYAAISEDIRRDAANVVKLR